MGEYPKTYRVFVKEGLGTLRAEMIDGNAWFYGVDICKILDLPKMCRLVSTGTIKEGDYVLVERLTKSGRRKIYLINASGVNALLDTRRAWKDENKVATFLKWFCDEVALTLHDYKLDVDAASIKLKEDDKVVKEFPEKEERVTDTIPDQPKKKTTVQDLVQEVNEAIESIAKQNNMTPSDVFWRAIKVLTDTIRALDDRVFKLEKEKVMDAIKQNAEAACGGKKSNAYEKYYESVVAACSSDLKEYMGICKLNGRPCNVDEAIKYVKEWYPSTNCRLAIKKYNEES